MKRDSAQSPETAVSGHSPRTEQILRSQKEKKCVLCEICRFGCLCKFIEMRLEEMRREGNVTNAEWTEVGFRGVEGAISALVLGMVLFAARARGCTTLW